MLPPRFPTRGLPPKCSRPGILRHSPTTPRSARPVCKRAKTAHDDLIAATHRAQADALEIEAQAKRRLAEEYDAAQERGEVQADGRPKTCSRRERFHAATAADLGLSRKDIHDARLLRDAEEADPGIVRRTLDEKLARGEEPTRSAVRRAAEAKLQRSVDRLKRVQESVRRLEAEKAPPLTPEATRPPGRGLRHGRKTGRSPRASTRSSNSSTSSPVPRRPCTASRPRSRHAINTVPIRRAAAWLTEFSNLFEQETRNGNHASE